MVDQTEGPPVGWQDSVARCIAASSAVGTVVGKTEAGSHSYVTRGVTDLDRPEPVDEHTLFAAYSISKAFTALAVLRICLSDRIDLDEPVNDRLRSLTVVPADERRPVTLRHLLTHTAGVPSPADIVYRTPRYVDLCGGAVRCQTVAGEEWAYSNGGFGVLSEWVEDVTQLSFESALSELVLRPLGMMSSNFHDAWPAEAASPSDASGRRTPKLWPNVIGAGGLCATADDLLTVADVACSPESAFAAVFDIVENPQRPTSYPDIVQGVGFMLRSVRGQNVIWHHGAGTGGYGEFFIDRDAGVGAALLTNSAIDLGACAAAILDESRS